MFDVSKSFSKQSGLYFVPIVMLTTLCELCFSKLSKETYTKIQVFSLTSNVKGKNEIVYINHLVFRQNFSVENN